MQQALSEEDAPIPLSRSGMPAVRKGVSGAPSWSALRWALLRILFGCIWIVDAVLKWQPAFRANYAEMLASVAKGQPALLQPWFHFLNLLASDGRATILAYGTGLAETYLAVAVLTGFARKLTYGLGAVYTFIVWAAAEGFGGPYVPGATTDVGAAIVYTIFFLALLALDAGAGHSRLSLDQLIERRFLSWRRIAELAN